MKNERVSVVTGASRGIGYEVARQLLLRGDTVVVTSRVRDDAAAAAAEIDAKTRSARAGGRVIPAVLDVASDASVAGFGRWLGEELGRVSVLVNNAGIALDKWVSALDVSLAVARTTMETNFFGALAVSQAVVPLMRKGGYGRIVNMSTQLASLERMGGKTLAYRASKAAVNALTRALADELRGANILVNSVCPGWTRTELGGADATRLPEEAARGILWLTELPDDGPTGAFFLDGERLPW